SGAVTSCGGQTRADGRTFRRPGAHARGPAVAGDAGGAVRLARQAEQVQDEIPPSIARACSSNLAEMLIQADDFAAAERVCAAALAACRDAGDQWNLSDLLTRMTLLDLRAGRTSDAAAHLRESLQLALQTAI